jgi:hypothetical protein
MKSVVLAFALATAATPALAEQTVPAVPAAPAADPAALAAAERLMEAMNYDKLMDQMMDAMVAQFRQSMPSQIDKMTEKLEGKMPSELKEKLVEIAISSMERSIRGNKATFRRGTALIYARHFTVAEIDRLTEIQKDPVMVKMLANMPGIMAESMAMTQAAMADEMPQMLEDVKRMVTDYLEAHPQNEAAAAPAA